MKQILTVISIISLCCFSYAKKPSVRNPASAPATKRPYKMRLVQSVKCKSGAPVNPAESIKVGMMLPLQAESEDLEGTPVELEFDMLTDGSEKISGKDACPKGDFLVIQFAEE